MGDEEGLICQQDVQLEFRGEAQAGCSGASVPHFPQAHAYMGGKGGEGREARGKGKVAVEDE